MAQLSDDCFAFGGPLLTVDAAAALIVERIPVVAGIEHVPLSDVDGRVLAADITAPLPLPPFDNSAVDGYAVRAADLVAGGPTLLPVAGRIIAGTRDVAALTPGTAGRIFTGACMPSGADTVFMQEDVVVEADGRVRLPPGLKVGANRRLAGEDLNQGAPALRAGLRIRPQDLALAASLGLTTLPVHTRLRVAVASTGNEVVAPGEPLPPGSLYDANRFLLLSLVRRAGAIATDGGIIPDQPDLVAERLTALAANHDLVITSGGVSTGEEDHVRSAVDAAGSLVFWRIAIKPGRPVALGLIAGTPFIGLPGNPVAAYVTFVRVARLLIARLGGEVFTPPTGLAVVSGFRYRKKVGRREYVRVRLTPGEAGPVALKHPREGAGVITSLTETDGLLELPEDATELAVGDPARFLSYAELS